MTRFVYADNAATSKLNPKALDAMMPYLQNEFGNPSSVYTLGRTARRAVADARESIAINLNALDGMLYFTASGTEADNWAIRGTAEMLKDKGRHIISTQIEHHAVLYTLQELEKKGFEVTYLPVDAYGMVNPDDLAAAIRPDTILVTIMFANNEIGTIQPIADLCAIAKERDVLFHTDAVQAVGHLPIDIAGLGLDMLSLSAHKFGGPRGIGALFVKNGIKLPAFVTGGGQERGLRAGTENVAGIVGMAAALEQCVQNMDENLEKITKLRDRLVQGLLQMPYTDLTGDPVSRLAGIGSFVFACIEGEALVLLLDQAGIAASSGSACSSGALDPSHVLLSIGLAHEVAHGSLRFSLNEDSTEEDVDYMLEQLPPIVQKLRDMSPLWEGMA